MIKYKTCEICGKDKPENIAPNCGGCGQIKRHAKPVPVIYYDSCVSCLKSKAKNTSMFCASCSFNKKRQYDICGYCSADKLLNTQYYCRACNRDFKKGRTPVIKDKNPEVVEFVHSVIARGCIDFYDTFRLLDLWINLNENNIHRYDDYTTPKQIKRMWRDLLKQV